MQEEIGRISSNLIIFNGSSHLKHDWRPSAVQLLSLSVSVIYCFGRHVSSQEDGASSCWNGRTFQSKQRRKGEKSQASIGFSRTLTLFCNSGSELHSYLMGSTESTGMFLDVYVCWCLMDLQFRKVEPRAHAKCASSWHSDHIKLLIRFITSEAFIYLKYHSQIYVVFGGIINDILENACDIL